MSSGPIFEELPDDYEEAKPSIPSASSGTSRGSGKTGRSSKADGVAAGFKKGFFDKKPARPAAVAASTPAASRAEVVELPAATASAVSTGSKAAEEVHESSGSSPLLQGAQEAEIASLLETLRAKLRSSGSVEDEQAGLSAGSQESLDDLREALTSATTPASRWPTTQARSALSKSSQEANAALADMRGSSNDARRMRSGEEKKVVSELRRVTDEVLERVNKVVELSAPKAVVKEDKIQDTVAAFHALPFTSKLRLFADDRVALSLVATSFVGGMILVMAFLAEVYSAWGCGYRCGTA